MKNNKSRPDLVLRNVMITIFSVLCLFIGYSFTVTKEVHEKIVDKYTTQAKGNTYYYIETESDTFLIQEGMTSLESKSIKLFKSVAKGECYKFTARGWKPLSWLMGEPVAEDLRKTSCESSEG